MSIDFLKDPNNTVPPPPLILEYSDDEMAQIYASAELTVFIQLFGRKLGSFQLGSYLHGFFKLDGRVEVYEHGHCRYSAKFSSQKDYDRATQRNTWRISDRCFIKVYKWQPNFQFGQVPLLHAGDYVEVRLEGLPIEYFKDIAMFKLVNAVCESLGCQVFMVDSSNGKPPRFWFQLIDSKCCLDLPLHVQIVNGPLVGLSYSPAQRCYHCGQFGHFRKTCPELNQRTRSLNHATPSTSGPGPSQVHRAHFSRQPVLVSDLSSPTSLPEDSGPGPSQVHRARFSRQPVLVSDLSSPTSLPEDSGPGPSQVHRSRFSRQPVLVSDLSSPTSLPEDTQGGIQDRESTSRTSSEESREGTSEITPFSPIKFFARCSGSISPSRPIEEMEMGAKGLMLVENGGESRAKLYNIGEKVCGIDGAVKVTNLNYQRGNQRRVTIMPRAGNVPRCSKKLLYTTIEDAEDHNALRALKDTCDEKDVSMAIVFDKSSVLINDDQIARCFGFSASHSSEMTFRSFGSDGSVRDVKGNCLLMWNGEELRVNVSPVSYGNTQLLSQHLEFNASWLVVESDSDESSNGFSSSEGESSIDSSQYGDTDSDESSFFSSSGEGISNESSTSSSSSSESSISLPNSATTSEESSLFSTDAEEISNGSSAPSTSEESNDSFVLSPNGE